MPKVQTTKKSRNWIDASFEFKPGDPMPEGYTARAEWAEVQLKSGLRQKRCVRCMCWCFPQQLSGKETTGQARTSRGHLVTTKGPICKECDAKNL